MRLAAAVAGAICLIAGGVRADPPPEPLGADVYRAIQQMDAGQVAAGRAALEALALAGRADAAEVMGELLRQGPYGVKADPAEACRFFALGAERRGDAAHNLALCHEQGVISGAPDFVRAAQFYEKAGALGYGKAKCALGTFYRFGKGVAKDPARGLALCEEAARAGYADAMTDAGDILIAGEAGPRDPAKARGYYEGAALQNQRNALMTLGQIHWNGDGVAKDHVKAAAYWRRSYEAGRIDAAKFLGDEAYVRSIRQEGVWTVEGLEEANGWYVRAAQAETPQIRAEAAERAELTGQLKDAMLRRARSN